jgi:hypothetical protein
MHLGSKIIFIFFTLLSFASFSQRPADESEYKSELTLGFNTNTNGGLISGLNFRYLYQRLEKNEDLYYLEFANIKSDKEERFTVSTNKSFILGKVNYLFAIRPSYGREINLFQKFPEHGARLNFTYSAGPTFGIVKPYFILYPKTDTLGTETIAYDPSKHDDQLIEGDANMLKGMNLAKLNPGIHARSSLNFEYGPYPELLLGIEAGVTAELFAKKNILLENNEQKRFYSAFFLHFYYGFSF